jgi:hypothetical protein
MTGRNVGFGKSLRPAATWLLVKPVTRQRKEFVDIVLISFFQPIGSAVSDQRNVNPLLRETERR